MTSRNLKGFALAAAAMALTLAGCASDSRIEPQAGAAPAAGALPGGRMETEAMAFESFMRRARGIDAAGFSSADDVRRALQVGASHEPTQLEAGMVAYAAMAALQEPSFVAGVQRAQSGNLAARLLAEPQLALTLPGGQAAAGRANAALLREGESLAATGQRVKRASYTVQHQAWSKAQVADPRGRLSQVKRLSEAAYRPEPGDAARLRESLVEDARRGGASSSPVVTRGVALAALSVLGEEGRGRWLMSDGRAGSCLRMAKLNLYQCLASAGPQYEDVYCLGQHAMIDPGQCVAEATRTPAVRRMTPVRTNWRR